MECKTLKSMLTIHLLNSIVWEGMLHHQSDIGTFTKIVVAAVTEQSQLGIICLHHTSNMKSDRFQLCLQ